MPTFAFAREVQTGTIDALVTANGDFAGGTLASTIKVPVGCTKIYQIGVTWGVGATAGAATCGMRITGSGVKYAQNLVLASAANDGTAVTMEQTPIVHDVDIELVGGGELMVQVYNGGTDTGTPETGFSILMR